jgi:hypothetical protein
LHPLCGADLRTLLRVLITSGGIAPQHLPRAAIALAAATIRAPFSALVLFHPAAVRHDPGPGRRLRCHPDRAADRSTLFAPVGCSTFWRSMCQRSGATEWHINADEAGALDYRDDNLAGLFRPDPYRSSDHDPVVIGLALSDDVRSTDDHSAYYAPALGLEGQALRAALHGIIRVTHAKWLQHGLGDPGRGRRGPCQFLAPSASERVPKRWSGVASVRPSIVDRGLLRVW